MMIGRSLAVALLALGTSALAEDPPERDARLRIGVRVNVDPFASLSGAVSENRSTKSGPLSAHGYSGYMVYVCDEVLKEMSIGPPGTERLNVFDVTAVPIRTGGERFQFLMEGKIDILCDPATITREAVKQFAVSPPLFATGISFLQRRNVPPPREEALCLDAEHALIGVVGDTTAVSYGIDAILQSGEWNEYNSRIVQSQLQKDMPGVCPIDANVLMAEEERRWVVKPYDDHVDLAADFCSGKVTYYVGDLEIIATNATRIPGCDWSRSPRSYSSDRYGIFANIDYTGDPDKALLIGRFFEILNREIATTDSVLDRAYVATFRAAPKSQALELFYWSVRGVR